LPLRYHYTDQYHAQPRIHRPTPRTRSRVDKRMHTQPQVLWRLHSPTQANSTPSENCTHRRPRKYSGLSFPSVPFTTTGSSRFPEKLLPSQYTMWTRLKLQKSGLVLQSSDMMPPIDEVGAHLVEEPRLPLERPQQSNLS